MAKPRGTGKGKGSQNVPPTPAKTAEQAEAERSARQSAGQPPLHAPQSIRPRDEHGLELGAHMACKCPTCRYRFNIGPFTREQPARPEDQYQCPNKPCGDIRPLYQFQFNVRADREFFGEKVTCSNRIPDFRDPSKRTRCGEVFRDKMAGPGAYDAKNDIGGMFRCCPRCGALPPRALATSTGRPSEAEEERNPQEIRPAAMASTAA